MKVIDLYVKIANGTPVKKVKYKSYVFEYTNSVHDYYYFDNCIGVGTWLFDEAKDLNTEVEIIEDTPKEDKKIEKLPYYSLDKIQKAKNKDEWREERISLLEKRINDYHNKINEIIDKINGE